MATSSPAPSYTPSGSTAYTSSSLNNVQTVSANQTSDNDFTFPTYTTFPPFYTLQPNLTTRARQLELWSSLITSYSAHNRLFKLSLSSPTANLFTNPSIKRSLKPTEIRQVLDHMAQPANGSRIEYIPPTAKGEQSSSCYVWWRTPGEWADLLYAWVEETGQKNSVLTIYELRESDAVRGKEWRDMDEGMLRKILGVCVKRNKAQVFGQAEGEGVKFF